VAGILDALALSSGAQDHAGIDRASAQCGAVTLIQRFGSARST